MASDTSLIFNLVARDRVSSALRPVAAKLEAFGTKIGAAVAGVGVATPYVAAAATAAGALAAGATAAGLAVGAFKAAVVPQLTAVADASTAAAAAEAAHTKAQLMSSIAAKAAAKGGKEYKTALSQSTAAAQAARQADAAAAQQLAGLPPATRATALAFAGLKTEYQKWSDALSSTTMPIFTRGIQGLRAALPALTPLVQAAAKAIGGFVGSLATGLQSSGFRQWVADFAKVAGPVLSDILTVVKNLAVGVGSLLHAFLPMSAGMTGGLAKLSGAFANWASHVQNSAGFQRFLSVASSGKGALGNLAKALGQLLTQLAPFMGSLTITAQALANVIAAIPTPVITVLAHLFIAASVGMKAWALATTIWSGVQKVATAVQWAMNSALLASPITWIIIGIVALVAVIVLIATKTDWFQRLWKTVWGAIQTAISAVWTWIKSNWPYLVGILTGPIGIAAAVIYKHWDQIKSAASTAWNWIWTKIKQIGQFLVNLFMNWTLPGLIIKHWTTIKDGTVRVATAMLNWVKALPGRIIAGFAGFGTRLAGIASSAWASFKRAVVSGANAAIGFVSRIPGAFVRGLGNIGSRLYNSGRSLLAGFLRGIVSYASTIYDKVSGIVSKVRDFFPFSPAKVGPFSGRGYTTYSGAALMEGFAEGVQSRRQTAVSAVGQVMTAASAGAQAPAGAPRTQAAPMVRGANQPVVLEFRSSGSDVDNFIVQLVRKAVRDRGGNVQVVLGQAR